MASTNLPFVDGGSEYQNMLDEIALYLLNDNQSSAASDEVKLISRVDSLCCLLKEPAAVQSFQTSSKSCVGGPDHKEDVQLKNAAELRDDKNMGGHIKVHLHPEEETKDVSVSKQTPAAISRKDSFGDLLLHLPRIMSLPKFLFNISDGDEGQD